MAAATAWAGLPPDQVRREEEASQARELVWFLDELQTILQSVRAALDDIADLLNPAASSPACTLVMSSLRSEAVKGYITRVGTRIVKGDITVKLPSLPAPKSAAGTRLTISPSSSTAVSSTTTTAPARPTSSITNVPTTLPVTTTTTTGTGGGSAAPRLGADEAREQQSASNLVSASAPASTEQNVPVVVLQQLVTVRNEVDAARDVVDAARWAGDVHDASFIAGQLSLLHDHLSRGRTALRYRTDSSTGTGTGADADTQAKRTRTDGPDRASDGGTDTSDGGGSLDAEDDDDWAKPESLIDPNSFDPPLPPNISFHLTVRDAALTLHLRTLELLDPSPASTPSAISSVQTGTAAAATGNSSSTSIGFASSLRDQFAVALAGVRLPHAQIGMSSSSQSKTYVYRARRVRVRERVRVESQDPALMSALAKLAALQHNVAVNRRSLDIVMGSEE